MPSPWRLRVADASAASSASKMISLSTPFSFETASTTIRISLFIVRTFASKLSFATHILHSCSSRGREARLVYAVDRQTDASPVHLERDVPLADIRQSTQEPPPP